MAKRVTMGWETTITRGLRPVTDLVYPPRCPACGVAVAAQGGLCLDCWNEIEVLNEPSCAACQRPLDDRAAAPDALCFQCAANPPRHSGIIAATVYNDASRKLVLTFKHGGKIALAPLLGRMIAARIDVDGAGVADNDQRLIVPVPLHRWRLWQRGFNQAALLAREVARAGKGTLLVDALIRRRSTPSLGGLGRDARERTLAGAITVRDKRMTQRIARQHIILVDDVLTSAATSNACVDALLDAGAASVRVACFARVLDH